MRSILADLVEHVFVSIGTYFLVLFEKFSLKIVGPSRMSLLIVRPRIALSSFPFSISLFQIFVEKYSASRSAQAFNTKQFTFLTLPTHLYESQKH